MVTGSLDSTSAAPPDREAAELGAGEETELRGLIGAAGPAANARLPPLIICAGEAGSGSTWLFNVAAEILSRHSPQTPIIRRYLDEHTQEDGFSDQDGIFVVKTHVPPPWVFSFANISRIPILLSVRDPRDAATSLITRFGESFATVLERIGASGRALAPLLGRPNVLLLRYEDQFTQKLTTLELIADHLGVPLRQADRDDIFERHTPQAVNKTIVELASKGAFKDLPAAQTWDEETQWHPSHVGDGRAGKWRDALTDAQAASVNYSTRIFRARFGYDTAPPVASGTTIDFSVAGFGAYYLDDGFSEPEARGVWTIGECATLRIELTGPISRRLHISIKCSLGPALLTDLTGATLRVLVDDREIGDFVASSSNTSQLLLSAWVDDNSSCSENIVIRFLTSHVLSPRELGLNTDPRPLGISLSSMHLEYT